MQVTAASTDTPSATRLCDYILGMDSSILFASVCSMGGDEIASASKPSVHLMIGSSPQMKGNYSAVANAIVNLFRQGEPLLGELTDIVASYKALKVMIFNLGLTYNAMVVLVATKDLDSKNAAFRISRVTRNLV